MKKKILVYQGVLNRLAELSGFAQEQEVELVPVQGGREAISLAKPASSVGAVLDASMPQMSGVAACRQIKEQCPGTFVVMLSSIDSPTLKEHALSAGCDYYVPPGETGEGITEFLRMAVARAEEEIETGPSSPSWASDLFDLSNVPDPAPPTSSTPPAPASVVSPSVAPPPSPTIAPSPEVPEAPAESQRAAPRFEAQGPVNYFQGEGEKEGTLLNLSRGGILFGAHELVGRGTRVTVQCESEETGGFVVEGTVVRAEALSNPRQGCPFAAGAKFKELDAETADKLDRLIAGLARQENRKKKPVSLSPEAFRQIMNGDWQLLQPLFQGQNSLPGLADLLGESTDLEKKAFSEEDELSLCVRALVVARVHCSTFLSFLPKIAENPGTFAEPFLPFLTVLFAQLASLEEEADKFVRQAVAEENETLRQSLNEASNRLHEYKIAVIFQTVETLQGKNVGSAAPVLAMVVEKAKLMRDLSQTPSEEVKYARRASPPQATKKDKEEKKDRKGKKPIYSRWSVRIGFSLLLVVAGFEYLSGVIGAGVSDEELLIPLGVTKLVKDEETLFVHSTQRDWDRLRRDVIDGIFPIIEAYLHKEKLRQAKIYDEKGKMMAYMSSGRSGRNVHFAIRILRKTKP